MTTRKRINKIRQKKLNSKTKRNKTKRNKTKLNKKKHHIGGQQQSLPITFTVEYSGLGIIKPNQDLTGQSQYYNNQPIIKIQNLPPNANTNSLYLIIMYDPDAPNGLEVTDKSSNHIYTHWVATINTNTNNNGNIKQILVKYAPPTPPKGTHRYIFNLYDVTQKKDDFLNTLKMNNNNNNNDTRSSYYNNKLSNLDNSNPIIFSTSYTVKANNA